MRTLLASLFALSLVGCVNGAGNEAPLVVAGEDMMTLAEAIAYCDGIGGVLYYEYSYERGREALDLAGAIRGWTAGTETDENGNYVANVVLFAGYNADGRGPDFLAYPLCEITSN